MRTKITLFLLPILLVLALFTSVSLAAPAEQDHFNGLLSLTQHFPKDTLAFGAIRTDGEHIALLDTLVRRVVQVLPPDMLPPNTPRAFNEVLDLAAGAVFNGSDFNTAVRPWLGNGLAAGMYMFRGFPEYQVAIQITDRPAATRYLGDLLARRGWQRDDQAGYSLFTVRSYFNTTNAFLIRDDVAILSTNLAALDLSGVFQPNLGVNRYFNGALTLLPGSSYNVIGYVDTPMLLAYAVGSNDYTPASTKIALSAFIRAIGPTAVGGLRLDDDTLTLDVAQSSGNKAGLEALGIHFGGGKAVDPTFLANVPSDSILIGHGTDIHGSIDFARKNLGAITRNFTYIPLEAFLISSGYSAATVGLVSVLRAEANGAFDPLPGIVLANLTGVDYQHEMQPWLNSDYAFFSSYNSSFDPGARFSMSSLPVNGGVIFKTSDPAVGRNFVTKLAREVPITVQTLGDRGDTRLVFSEESINGGAVFVVGLMDYYDNRQLGEALVGANDSVVVFGTRSSVTSVLDGANGGLVADPHVLPNAGTALYFRSAPLKAALDQLEIYGQVRSSDSQAFRVFTRLISGATISAAGSDNADLLLRFTLILNPQ